MTDFSPLNFPLPEALQYTLTNLGRENFNPAALERLRAELRSGQTTNQ